jgi:hypothetical protein
MTGVLFEGLSDTVLPPATAAQAMPQRIASRKLHGEITTPSRLAGNAGQSLLCNAPLRFLQFLLANTVQCAYDVEVGRIQKSSLQVVNRIMRIRR